jgi:hypothetical protein
MTRDKMSGAEILVVAYWSEELGGIAASRLEAQAVTGAILWKS